MPLLEASESLNIGECCCHVFFYILGVSHRYSIISSLSLYGTLFFSTFQSYLREEERVTHSSAFSNEWNHHYGLGFLKNLWSLLIKIERCLLCYLEAFPCHGHKSREEGGCIRKQSWASFNE